MLKYLKQKSILFLDISFRVLETCHDGCWNYHFIWPRNIFSLYFLNEKVNLNSFYWKSF